MNAKSKYIVSSSVQIFHQNKPPRTKKSNYKLWEWTDTIEGSCNEAKKLSFCLYLNRRFKDQYSKFWLTIYISKYLTLDGHKELWRNFSVNAKAKGLTAFWVREPTRKGGLHYHLLVNEPTTAEELTKLVTECMPPRKVVWWRHKVKPVRRRHISYLEKYAVKAKVRKGNNPDRWAKKRLLFKKGLGLRKHGSIGDYWLLKPEKLYKVYKVTFSDELKEEALSIHALVDPSVSLKQVIYTLQYFALRDRIL